MRLSTLHTPSATSLVVGVRFFMALIALVVLIGAADALTQIHKMSASLEQVEQHLGTLQSMDRELVVMKGQLDQTNRSLGTTNAKLDSTNARLALTNSKLNVSNAGLSGMKTSLQTTVRDLGTMNAQLVGMRTDLNAMEKKLVHAKLLF